MAPLRVAIVGNVDHGKSTIIGRLLSDTGQIRDDRVRKVRRDCEAGGRRFEYAFLLDALEEEQQQGITIDVTEVPWTHAGRDYTIVDTPGHREFLKNMIGGASRADAAILVVDAVEGLKSQFRRQVAVLRLLGIPRVLVVINKMDLINWSEAGFRVREQEIERLFAENGMGTPRVLPVAAWSGANLLVSAAEMPWFRGPTLARALSDLPPAPDLGEMPLRLPIQDVYKFDDRRIYVGRVESGRIQAGDSVRFWPSGRLAAIRSVEEPHAPLARPGDAVGFTLTDPLYLERGDLGCAPENPPRVSRALETELFWLAPEPLLAGRRYLLRCGHSEVPARVEAIAGVLNPETLERAEGGRVDSGAIARVHLALERPLVHDFFNEHEATGRFVLVHDHRVVGGGRILADKRAYLSTELSDVSPEERTRRFGHRGAVIWSTGLPGSGKSTIMRGLERELFTAGIQVFVLDGDNVRQGLNRDLGFSAVERSENIRRVAEVARLFADAGSVVLTAFLSPFASDRERARAIVGPDRFMEVFVDCPIEVCEYRDPKHLFAKARKGELASFTGLSSPYERPLRPDVHLRTDQLEPSEAVARLADEVRAFVHATV